MITSLNTSNMATVNLDMNSEFRRYASFNGFHPPPGVWTLQLAHNGFYHSETCQEYEVVCFSCGMKLDVRSLSSQRLMDLHRRFAPLCSFVSGSSNNQPVPSFNFEWLKQNFSFGPSQFEEPLSVSLMSGFTGRETISERTTAPEERFRISEVSTFDSVPILNTQDSFMFSTDRDTLEEVEPSDLQSLTNEFISAFQTSELDSTPSTGQHQDLEVIQVQPPQTRQAFGGHESEMLMTDGECLEPVGNYPPLELSDEETVQYTTPQKQSQQKNICADDTNKNTVTFDELGIIVQRPKRQDLAALPARQNTFWQAWSKTGATQTEEMLAEAGFYYAGYADCCRCFYCGGGLKSWEKDDDPWIEHARWFETCPYVLVSKGHDFVNAVQSLARTNIKVRMTDVLEEISRVQNLTYGNSTTGQEPCDNENMKPSTIDNFEEQFEDEPFPDNSEESAEELANENERLKAPTICKICMDKEVCILYVPCGHLVTCSVCGPSVKECPVCRQKIRGQIRTQSD